MSVNNCHCDTQARSDKFGERLRTDALGPGYGKFGMIDRVDRDSYHLRSIRLVSHFRLCSGGPIHCPVCVLLRQMASEDGHLRRSRWNVPFEPLENEFAPYAKGAFRMLRTRADEQEISISLFPYLGRSNAEKFKGISCGSVPAVAKFEQFTLIAHLGNKS